jgi:hypothetical protein
MTTVIMMLRLSKLTMYLREGSMRHLLFVPLGLALLALQGCYFTQAGAIKELSVERSMRYEAYIAAQQNAVTALTTMLATTDRGGMKVELDSDGRVKAIQYTEKLDITPLVEASKVTPYQEEKVTSLLGEMGDFVMKATNLAVPFSAIYYGHKNHVSSQAASVAMNSSNNAADTAMWSSFTNGFNNSSTVSTSVSDIRDTSSTLVSDIRDTSSTLVSDISSSVSITDNSSTASTSVSDIRDTSSTLVSDISITDKSVSITYDTKE